MQMQKFWQDLMEILHQVLTLPPKVHSIVLHTDVKCYGNAKCWPRREGCSAWAVDGEDIPQEQ